MKPFEKFVLLVVAWGFAVGCGGEGSGGHVDTGLADATALRDITSEESVPACQSVRSTIQAEFSVDQNVRHACELFGATLTDSPEECRSQADSCVSQTENGTNGYFNRQDLDFGASIECDGDVGGFEDCAVTVGEYEACMNDRIDQLHELFARFDCAAAARIDGDSGADLISELTTPATPASCERLETECPMAGPFSGS